MALLSTLDGPVQILDKTEPWPPCDLSCPLLSLPLAFDTALATVPNRVPYLRADPLQVMAWQRRLGVCSRPRIGIAWSGSAANRDDASRSIALATLLPLLSLPVEWHCLQNEFRDSDLPMLRALPAVHVHQEDLASTAALIQCLDLVITVDTSIAHLAGGLGRPVWVLLARVPDFRWLLERVDSPWYPTARLFRQSRRGRWEDVVARVTEALAQAFPPS